MLSYSASLSHNANPSPLISINHLQLELSALEKKEELIKMQKEAVLQELRKEKKRALLLLQNSLEQDDALIW